MNFNPTMLTYAANLVKQAQQSAPAIQSPEAVKQAAFNEALRNNTYWEEMAKQAAIQEDMAAEQLFNQTFAEEFTKLASDFATQYGFLPEAIAACFQA